MNQNNKEDLDLIETFVQKEEKAAFNVLSEEILRSRLESRLRKRLEEKRRILPVFLRPITLILATVFFICVAIVALLLRPSNARKGDVNNPVEMILLQSPGINSLVRIENLYEANLKQIDSLMPDSKSEIEKLYHSLQNLRQLQTRKKYDFSYGKMPSHLELDDLMLILVKEKTVHKFFSKYIKGFKEEDNDSKSISFRFDKSVFCIHFRS
jgi:hypothetical protein